MKFFDCSTAPSPRRVRIFLAEKGIDLETVQVDLASGEQFGEAFRAINPDCVVPALQLDDGTCLSEVIAISLYLEDKYPDPPLLGSDPLERALISMWNAKVEQQGIAAVADAFRNTVGGLKGRAVTGSESYEQIPELAERGRRRVLQFFQRLDGQLADNRFVAGKAFSIADISALVAVDFARRSRIEVPEDAVNLRRWYGEVAERPSAQA